ncbi:hypothetical protein PPL_02160 [Heterostelium album PN500]|uniref:Defective in cullin neddylation protein n=1 Tax=Heterostelium pallidum (strain ATCC 26659 / Pp 5 / PN500) TaxID=670386 RepID=D3B1I6_HETP5|nr:hypothetical protein PPL_02160 [Heterostelium album PN500]EFA85160.1 hypothetical protein PPL_02160 [Heterostelium album PN500]|eukprot:XP_020437269.1 hypothetical protein PPL_02160 [Heterostelium album PN500]
MARKASTKTTTVNRKRKTVEDEDKSEQPVVKKVAAVSPLASLFDKYKDAEEPNCIGPDGVTKFCEDLGFAPDSIQVLILAWQMNASKMGYFTFEEFKKGFEKLHCTDLIQLKKELQGFSHTIKVDPAKFAELYKFSFGFASEIVNKKSVELAIAAEMLELVIPDGPHTKTFISFLNSTKNYKVINKDQWICFLEFSKTVKEDLSNYDEYEAWPLLIDEFVDFVKDLKK